MKPATHIARLGLLLAAGIFAVTSLPYLYATLSSPSDLIYTGFLFDVPDHTQYWSWVTASRSGLFIRNTMTPEPNAPIFMNPLMWLLARTAAVFDMSFPALFQLWRAAAACLLMIALVALVRETVTEPVRRRTALLIAITGSGFGWTLVIWKKLLGAADVPWPSNIYVVEPNTLFGLLAYPYQPFAQSFLVFAILGLWWIHRRRSPAAYGLAVAAAVCLALFHAYDLITLYTVFVGYTLVCWMRARRFPMHLAIACAVVILASAPVALYYEQLTAHDPLWRSILSQYANAGVWTPRHIHLLILLGAPLLLAACAALWPRFDYDDCSWLMVTWAAAGLLLIYLPVVYQIKLLGGLQFPLAVLAAHAWHDRAVPLFGRLARTIRPSARRGPFLAEAFAVVTLALMILPTTVYLFCWRFVDIGRHAPPYYLHRDEMAALDWLAREGRDSDVVLARLAIGQFVPNYGGSRAYLAHWAMTNRFYERRELVDAFFSTRVDDAWRARLLRAEGVTMVLRSTEAGGQPDYDPSGSPLFEPALILPRAQIYRLNMRPTALAAQGTGQ